MRIALFPLHAVLFPGARIPLHVFEPRYRTMMASLSTSDPRFGVVAISAGTEVGAPAATHDVGTIAVVEQLRELDDGRFELVARGGRRFAIVDRLPDDPFPRADVRLLADDDGEVVETALAAARAAFARYAAALSTIGATIHVPEPADAISASFAYADGLLVDLPLRQRLLACETAADRLQLAGAIARREATLLATIGPSAGVPIGRPSPN